MLRGPVPIITKIPPGHGPGLCLSQEQVIAALDREREIIANYIARDPTMQPAADETRARMGKLP